ncbi:SIMPL domain-containing protein, partial [Enterobacter quasiroggenkampii]|nr:SIMPL domain-containing protein [Enterobacter quasiroggenkampii]
VPVHAEAAEFSVKDTVNVSGMGELEVTPDVAYAELAIDTRGKTAAEAQKQNAVLFEKVKQVLTSKYGVQEKDLKTVNFSVNPEYKYVENKEPQIIGYQATHAVRVTYRDLNRLGSLVDAATDAGVNRVVRIQFDTEKRADYEAQVLE